MNRLNPKIVIQPWKIKKTELVLDHRWAKVRRDECGLPNGEIVPDYFYWEGGDFAQVFAVTSDKKVVLTRQYKHGAKSVVIELPAGLIGTDGETALAAAKRELQEETGYAGDEWTPLSELNVSAAKSTTKASAFLLTDAVKIADVISSPSEQIETFLLPIDELIQYIMERKIIDVNSLAITFLATQKLGWLRRS
jgi:8-oxo-dGTP pyrophosphatase MutT (NUDIX family)